MLKKTTWLTNPLHFSFSWFFIHFATFRNLRSFWSESLIQRLTDQDRSVGPITKSETTLKQWALPLRLEVFNHFCHNKNENSSLMSRQSIWQINFYNNVIRCQRYETNFEMTMAMTQNILTNQRTSFSPPSDSNNLKLLFYPTVLDIILFERMSGFWSLTSNGQEIICVHTT